MSSQFLRHHSDDFDAPLVKQAPPRDDARFDITAMIDLVFMMNIFFLVTTIAAGLLEMDLPVARHVVAADLSNSVVISIKVGSDRSKGEVYIGDPDAGESFEEADEQTQQVRRAVEDGRRDLKQIVLIKAEKDVSLRVIQRVASAAGQVSGTDLRLAVIEKD